MAAVCPVVGTTNSTLPPSHPDVDLSQPGQICPVVGARTEHHTNLHKHPSVPDAEADHPSKPSSATRADASVCPALQNLVEQPLSRNMDDKICPVVGTATTILPPDHPRTADRGDDAECPVTKAKVGHHKGVVAEHPDPNDPRAKGHVCPVTGAKSAA